MFDTDGAIYMASQRDPAGCRVGLFGVPYDGTTSFRPGTRFGPAAIREVSSGLESYDPQLDRDLEELAIADLGAVDIPFGAPEPVVAAVKQATAAVLALGAQGLVIAATGNGSVHVEIDRALHRDGHHMDTGRGPTLLGCSQHVCECRAG